MTQAFKAEFNTRLLYHQNYSTEDGVHVASTMYAVMWGLHASPLTTTRVRLTSLYNITGAAVQPIQGLIEQWKNEGWVILDEFVDITREFDSQKEYEAYLMKMARSFLLGIPINSEIVSGDDDPKPAISKASIPELTSRLDKLIKKDSKIPDTFKEKATSKPSDLFASSEEVNIEKEKIEPELKADKAEDDSDDDEWL
tara:strand:- start:233 stop:826 length:594 start_codon:yes stop_codon:yes gene_type:complete